MDIADLNAVLSACAQTPVEARSRLEVWMRDEPLPLVRALPELLAPAANRPEAAFLAKALAKDDFDVKTLSDPAGLTIEEATPIVAALQQAGAGIEVRMAQHALIAYAGEPENGRKRRIRTIDILRRTLRSHHLMPFQVQLLRQDDPHVRSKAVQYLAELTNNAGWFRTQLKDTDPRVRANAVQALWHSQMQGAEEVLWAAAADPHHRVSTTALVGLWWLGRRDEAAERLLAISKAADPAVRAAGAWAMGELADRRFFDTLVRLSKDHSPLVRPRAFQGLRQLERARRETLQPA